MDMAKLLSRHGNLPSLKTTLNQAIKHVASTHFNPNAVPATAYMPYSAYERDQPDVNAALSSTTPVAPPLTPQ